MSFYSLLLIILLFYCSACSISVRRKIIKRKENETNHCTTANNKPGKCVNITQCPYLNEIFESQQTQEPKKILFLKKSFCQDDKDNDIVKVCCNAFVHTNTKINNDVTTSFAENHSNTENYTLCGISQVNAPSLNIIGGESHPLGDWPWMVAIGFRHDSDSKPKFTCAGSLISDSWILTAASCVTDRSLSIIARIGDVQLNDSAKHAAKPVNIVIDEIIPHPKFSVEPIANNIALLRLRKPVTFTERIRPICIPSTKGHREDGFYKGKLAYVTGWGDINSEQKSSSKILREVVHIVDPDTCIKKYNILIPGIQTIVNERVICASGEDKLSNVENLGGPMMTQVGISFYLIGIVSFTFNPNHANDYFPAIYIRVANFSHWITNVTGIEF